MSNATQPRLWPLYIGGFLGPFGGAMLNAILPEVAGGIATTEAGVATAITAYMIPFSLLMVVSGTFGTRWGLAKTVRWAYVGYAVASLVCAAAMALGPFTIGRALQGASNAFTTPLIVALISFIVPREKLGGSLGIYASFQAAGQAFAPLIGGLAAEWNYRLAFIAVAVVALALASLTPSKIGTSPTKRMDWASLRNVGVARSAGTALCAQFGSTAIMVLGALLAADRFGMSASQRGLVVASFGVAGFVLGRSIGRWSGQFGLIKVGMVMLLVLSASIALMGVAPWAAALVVLMATAGAAGSGTRILTNSMAIASTPSNVGGATSLTMSAQFLGVSAVPALIPLYHASAPAAFLCAAGVVLVGALIAGFAPAKG